MLTQAKYEMPMTDQQEEEGEEEEEENYRPENDRLRRFDKAEIRAIILGAGGRILQASPPPIFEHLSPLPLNLETWLVYARIFDYLVSRIRIRNH